MVCQTPLPPSHSSISKLAQVRTTTATRDGGNPPSHADARVIASYRVDALSHVDALSNALVPTVRRVRNVQLETAVHGCAVADALTEIGVIIITILLKLVLTVARPAKQKEPHRGLVLWMVME